MADIACKNYVKEDNSCSADNACTMKLSSGLCGIKTLKPINLLIHEVCMRVFKTEKQMASCHPVGTVVELLRASAFHKGSHGIVEEVREEKGKYSYSLVIIDYTTGNFACSLGWKDCDIKVVSLPTPESLLLASVADDYTGYAD